MPTIRFSAPAPVFDFRIDGDDPPVVDDPTELAALDGLKHDEIFSDYISDGGDKTLAEAGVSGGELEFRYDAKSKQLIGITEYTAPRLLTKSELALLKEYTVGQWSDGIGSNFFQERMSLGLAPQLPIDERAVSVEQRS
ncbi:hypothetical protein BWI17_00700 [Betaproteobacteria bacterium GR16-43]|nr:hypothetical protein BWI17_00700 [Betaproteobacteria bacterium GR16-43]